MASAEPWEVMEKGGAGINGFAGKDLKHGRMVHNTSSSSLRKKSDLSLVSKVRCGVIRRMLANLQEVILGTKLSLLLPAVPVAVAAESYGFGRSWVFVLSLIGLIPLAERLSFLTEQIAYFTGPTVGGLLNATCGNAPEFIIAVMALLKNKVDVVKYSLFGSVLSNLLLVLGTSLFCGGIANISKEQKFDRKQADVNSLMLLLALLCQILPLMFRYAGSPEEAAAEPALRLSRVCSIVMLIAYCSYLVFQLWTHRQLFESEEGGNDEDGDDDVVSGDVPVIGFFSGIVWLIGMTAAIAVLSEYIVSTLEEVSDSWGLPVGFIGIILLPAIGNAPEHAGAIIFGFKNKLDICLGVSLGSATQVAMFVVPMSVVVAWIVGVDMNLDFNLLETSSLAISILVSAFALQDGTSHYVKGLVLLLCYIVIAACFFSHAPLKTRNCCEFGTPVIN
ncbi:hypothetical protein NMG60_11000196 [Bertholletia excelsa]